MSMNTYFTISKRFLRRFTLFLLLLIMLVIIFEQVKGEDSCNRREVSKDILKEMMTNKNWSWEKSQIFFEGHIFLVSKQFLLLQTWSSISASLVFLSHHIVSNTARHQICIIHPSTNCTAFFRSPSNLAVNQGGRLGQGWPDAQFWINENKF